MIRALVLFWLLSTSCLCETTTGKAVTHGPCSPAVTGNNNRIIMNCQGIDNQKVEQPAFREKSGTVSFSLGENGLKYSMSVDQLRKSEAQPFVVENYALVTLKMRGETLLFSVKLLSPDGRALVEVENNEFTVTMPGADWNYTANALEVVNAQGVPIFQFIRKSPFQLVLKGIFFIPQGLLIADDGVVVGPTRPVPAIKPIFKYPAWKHPGKYADDSN